MPRHTLTRPGRRHAHPGLLTSLIVLAWLLTAAPLRAADNQKDADRDTYDQDSIVRDATDFFGKSAEGLAKVIEKAFKDHGRPNGYITGEEESAAITVGLREG